MSFKFKATSSSAPLEPGLYHASLTAIEARHGDLGEYLRWTFSVDEDDREVEVSALTSTKFSTTAKARKYAEALLGRTIKNGEELAPNELYGCGCLLVITVDTLNDGGTVNKVDQVLPLRAKADEDDDVPF
jgi:hypothetical protein